MASLIEFSPEENQLVSLHPVNVLLVDDQQMVYEAVRQILADEPDIHLHYCAESVNALNHANEIEPTVILQDLVMPKVDGLTLVRYYRANPTTSKVPLIVLSTREEAELKAKAFALGANDYVVKLPGKAELIARIRYHSNAYISLLQRDEAHAALKKSMHDLEIEQKKSETLLLNILPKSIAERLKEGESQIAEQYAETSVLFADIAGFTQMAMQIGVDELVGVLNAIFSRFDMLTEKHGVEKIKTIGDCYMAASGLPDRCEDHAEVLTLMALDMLDAIQDLNKTLVHPIELRIGINSGPVIAGIIGQKKFIYDLWGDTVNTASRMESHGIKGKIQITEETRKRLPPGFSIKSRGTIEIKGKGEMETFIVEGANKKL